VSVISNLQKKRLFFLLFCGFYMFCILFFSLLACLLLSVALQHCEVALSTLRGGATSSLKLCQELWLVLVNPRALALLMRGAACREAA
jgi:hypothetical protein